MTVDTNSVWKTIRMEDEKKKMPGPVRDERVGVSEEKDHENENPVRLFPMSIENYHNFSL